MALSEDSFEASLARLEEIVRRLEGGEEPLEEVLRLFREGVTLARGCAAQLDAAERVIEQLLELPDGRVELVPLGAGPEWVSSGGVGNGDGAA